MNYFYFIPILYGRKRRFMGIPVFVEEAANAGKF
nr:MAG TPA: hypothetical protein [Caudoviricetes sp.]